jgi:hypothetical protein
VLVLAGCGHSKKAQRPSATRPITATGGSVTTAAPSGSGATTPGAGALQAEANAAATGDIPDNQVFLIFRNRAAGYSMKYPEGWAQSGSGDRVTFRDKNNIIRVVVGAGAAPTVAQVRAGIRRLPAAHLTQPPTARKLGAARAIKVVYTTKSAPNPVTGKRVTLMVDRYYLAHAGKLAIVDLGTPRGVDNVDAYRLMIESVKWR